MFYSHQLLARKAPLGQIWMAATLHAKINRRSLDKLNIIQICEEILNPAVPMALRLSGILMGGVVIVYERKVKLLYDDVNRLLVEINKVWKVKDVTDSTILPKGKTQAKYEAVTLPENDAMEIGDIEHSLNFSTAATFQQTAYFSMRLDDVDINGYSREEEDVTQHYHQANPADITLFESFDTYPADTGFHNRFDRVDIEGDQGVQVDLTPVDQPQIPDTLIPSPPGQDDPKKGLSAIDEIGHQPTGQEANLFDESRGDVQPHIEHQRQGPTRRRARRVAAHIMDYKQTIIPGSVYQSWLQEASDIVSGRGRKRKRANFMSTMKISDLIKLSPIIFVSGLMGNGRRYIYYPTPLLELGMRRTESPGDSPSGISRPQPHEPSSSSSPLGRVNYQDFAGFPSEDFDNGAGSQSLSIEKTRAVRDEVQTEAVEDVLRTNLVNTGMRPPEANVMVTPGNSGDELRSIPSSGSGHGFSSHTSEIISGWKRAHSSSRRSGSSLETVAEENPWQEPVPHFKLARLSENGLRLTPQHELLVETGPTQTQIPAVIHPIDKITDSIRLHLKSHFDTPGAPQVESLDQLASGMNRKSAAQLFYQTSVLATHDFLRVQQKVPYGDILISRGAKM